MGENLLNRPGYRIGKAILRRFPDRESYVRILTDVKGENVDILCTLHQPDDKLMMIYFFSQLAKQLGAKSVRLIAPYLAYMRHDKEFHPGEAVTSDLFAQLLGSWIDELITIDPHLHRHPRLSDIYDIPTTVLHAGPLIVDHIRKHLSKPVLIGPDEESKQWVAAIASQVGCDFLVLKKERLGDRTVRIDVPDAPKFRDHSPVLVDDIISTGHTMMETAGHLNEHGIPPPVCIGVHAVFAGNAWKEMLAAGIRHIVTTNTIAHPSNAIDVSELLTSGLFSQGFRSGDHVE